MKNWTTLAFILVFILALRIPSFSEPLWDGNEAIYLTIGQALRKGKILYRDIWDFKPPLIYILYSIYPHLVWAKASATASVFLTVSMIFLLTKKIYSNLTDNILPPIISAILVGFILSLPSLGGYISNVEIYFVAISSLGAFTLYGSSAKRTILFSGILMSIATFTKIPAIFDFFSFYLTNIIFNIKDNIKESLSEVMIPTVVRLIIFLSSFLLISYYFFRQNALFDFLDTIFIKGLEYVEMSAGSWSSIYNSVYRNILILGSTLSIIVCLYFFKRISKNLLFISLWLSFSTFGTFLSNRPYVYYLIQMIPPLVVFLVYSSTRLGRFAYLTIITITVATIFSYKPTVDRGWISNSEYFHNYLSYITGRINRDEYSRYFGNSSIDNYQTTDFIRSNASPKDKIFVLGDDAAIYALSELTPAIKFIQMHHLFLYRNESAKDKDLLWELIDSPPKYIVKSSGEYIIPIIEGLLDSKYTLVDRRGKNIIFRLKDLE